MSAAFHTINDHKILVPNDMEVFAGMTGPGAYDFIAFRGHEILTCEMEVEPETYTGPFVVADDNCDLREFASLIAARDFIITLQPGA